MCSKSFSARRKTSPSCQRICPAALYAQLQSQLPGSCSMRMLAGAIAVLCFACAGIRSVRAADVCVDQEQRRLMEAIHAARAPRLAGSKNICACALVRLILTLQHSAAL